MIQTKITIFLLLLSVTVFVSSNVLALPKEWKKVDTRYDYNTVERFSVYLGMKCYDSLNCMIQGYLYGAGGYYIRRTTDGGETWKNIFMDSAYVYDMSNYKLVPDLNAISYPGPKLCIGVGDSGLIIRTTDKGETWEKKRLNDSIEFYRIIMADEYYGVIQGSYYKNRKISVKIITTDGGNSWNYLPKVIGLSEINFINRDTLYGLSQVPTHESDNTDVLIRVSNNWLKTDTLLRPLYTSNLDFINVKQGWISGGYLNIPDYKNATQIIASTSDGGETWSTQRDTKFNGCPIRDLKFFDENFGMATSCLSLVLITTDGGKYWKEEILDTNGLGGNISGLQVPSSSTAYIIMEGDHIYKYTRDWTDGVEEKEVISDEFSISPNPVQEFIEISVGARHALTNTDIRIFNVFGEIVSTSVCSADTSAGGGQRIDVSGLPSGVYFVRVGGRVGKFVKI